MTCLECDGEFPVELGPSFLPAVARCETEQQQQQQFGFCFSLKALRNGKSCSASQLTGKFEQVSRDKEQTVTFWILQGCILV